MGLFDGLDLEKLDAALSNLRVLKEFEQRPNRIILVRHGESEGNIDRSAYSTTPDSQIALTEHGFAQGAVAGLQIRQLIGNETVRFFVSPYLRARQTLLAILRAFDGQTVKVSSEPRLREQDFGNFQSHEAMRAVLNERQKFGRFYYRFPNGEAGTDVFDRMASFITYLFRTMSDATKGDYFESSPEAPSPPTARSGCSRRFHRAAPTLSPVVGVRLPIAASLWTFSMASRERSHCPST